MPALSLLIAAGRRIARALVLLLAVSALLFASVAVLPGDPATVILGATATPSQIAALRAELHLDEPAPLRYLHWLGEAVRGDLGTSVGTATRRGGAASARRSVGVAAPHQHDRDRDPGCAGAARRRAGAILRAAQRQ